MTAYCKTCGRTTTDAKPFCIEHLDNADYIARVRATNATRFGEVQLVLKKLEAGRTSRQASRSIDAFGPFSDDILDMLATLESMHMLQVCQVVGADRKHFDIGAAYSYALARANRAKLEFRGTRRGVIRPILVKA